MVCVQVCGSVNYMTITLHPIYSLIDSPFAIPTRCTYVVWCAHLQLWLRRQRCGAPENLKSDSYDQVFDEMNEWHWLICNENFTLELVDMIPSPAMLQSAPLGPTR